MASASSLPERLPILPDTVWQNPVPFFLLQPDQHAASDHPSPRKGLKDPNAEERPPPALQVCWQQYRLVLQKPEANVNGGNALCVPY